jgi:HK97 gp10 family phage protein
MKYVSYADEVKKKIDDAIGLLLIGIGEIVSSKAKLNAPVDTGRLRNSIDYETNIKQVIVGANTEYAPAVELGTSYQREQPYLEPAARQSGKDIEKLGQMKFNQELGGR